MAAWPIWGGMTTAHPQETIDRQQIKLSASTHGVAKLLAANALLAVGALFVRLADVGPIASAFWRLALGFPVLLALAIAVGGGRRVKVSGAVLVTIVFSGVLFAADLASWHLGIVRTKLANATLFGNCASLIFPLWGFILARAWPTRREGGALALAAVGAALLMGRSYELSPQYLVGDLFSLLAGIFYAVYFIVIAKARATLAALPLLAASTFASAIPMLGFAVIDGERIWPHSWLPLIALALVSQVLGQGLMVAALGSIRPLVIGLALLVQPIVAATIGWVVFGEHLTTGDLAGALLIAAALLLVRR